MEQLDLSLKKLKHLMPKPYRAAMLERCKKKVLNAKFENPDRQLSINFRIL